MTRASAIDEGEGPAIAAARWHERLASDPRPADLEAFDSWRSADPANAAAFARIEWASALARSFGSEPDIMALRHETLARVVMRGHAAVPWRTVAGMAASLVLAGGMLWWTLSARPEPTAATGMAMIAEGPTRSFGTRVGERLNVVLEDGSELRLDTGTTVRMQYTAGARRLALVRGQALFDVAKAPARPFTVAVAGRTVTAHGTRFNVRYDERAMEVALVEGVVTVAKLGDKPAREVTMRPNDRLVATGRGVSVRHYADLGRFLSWTRGVIQFDDVPLADAVREFNRYNAVPVLLDARVGAIRISGSFPTHGSAGLAEAMQAAFPVRMHRSAGGQIFLSYRD